MKIKSLDLFKFKKLVDDGTPFVVKFKSDRCHICDEIKGYYEEISELFPKIGFYDVDVDIEEDLADVFAEQGVPTIYFIKGKKFEEVDYPEEGYTRKSLESIIRGYLEG